MKKGDTSGDGGRNDFEGLVSKALRNNRLDKGPIVLC